MPLRIELKPGEKVFLGGAVLENGSSRSQFTVLNDVPVLRERDILTEKTADTPCKRIYLTIQLMYMDEQNLSQYHQAYWQLVRDLLDAVPSTLELLNRISAYILNRQYYQALKSARDLIAYEQDLLKHVE